MAKGRIYKIVGQISDEIVDRYKLYEYRNTDIVQSLDLYQHVAKHAKEFESVDSFNNALFNISDIIAKPIFVYYDFERKSLQYFKELDENVCVVVKLKLRKNKDNYVASVYPVNKQKIIRLKEQSYIAKDN